MLEPLFEMIELASEKGASSWLTTLPIKDLGFRLNKQHFVDAICLRYNLRLKDVPVSVHVEQSTQFHIACLAKMEASFI